MRYIKFNEIGCIFKILSYIYIVVINSQGVPGNCHIARNTFFGQILKLIICQ